MGLASRTKGASGERELSRLLADELGVSVTRRCRAHASDSDLLGIGHWSVECKRVKAAPRGDVATWWRQCLKQAAVTGDLPMLAYRADRTAMRRASAAMNGTRQATALYGGDFWENWPQSQCWWAFSVHSRCLR